MLKQWIVSRWMVIFILRENCFTDSFVSIVLTLYITNTISVSSHARSLSGGTHPYSLPYISNDTIVELRGSRSGILISVLGDVSNMKSVFLVIVAMATMTSVSKMSVIIATCQTECIPRNMHTMHALNSFVSIRCQTSLLIDLSITVTSGTETIIGQVRLGARYVIVFLYVQFWIRLGTVSYRGKKVRIVDSPAVRSVNKSRDTRNCVQNEPNMRSVPSSPLVYITKPEELFCVLWYSKYAAITIVLAMPMWSYSSPHDVSAEHGSCHGDNPWQFRNDVIV